MRTIDLFCGAGGSSWGAREAGAQIIAGFDKWDVAGKVYKDNFPESIFYSKPLEYIRLDSIANKIGKIDLLIASPECTNHSPAKGSSVRCEKSKRTAYQVTRFAKTFLPEWIVVENVIGMKKWSGYSQFIHKLEYLHYQIKDFILDSSKFGVPQKRRRLFLICGKNRTISDLQIPQSRIINASEIVDLNGSFSYNRLLTEKRAKATIARAERAFEKLGTKTPFLMVYYGTDHAGGWQTLDMPLRTITTLDRFAVVKPEGDSHVMRMLQVPELKKAMGFPDDFIINHGTRRDKIKMIGNAVCPPVMKYIINMIKHSVKLNG